MSHETGPEEPLSMEELTELLAEETATDPAEIERPADEFEIGPPEEAEVISE